MKRGQLADTAVGEAISRISAARLRHPSYLDHTVFAFPRVLTNFDEDRWTGGSVFLAAAASVALNPENRMNKGVPLRWYDEKHSIPSVIVPLSGIRDVEYHVSRRNILRLLSVGCICVSEISQGIWSADTYKQPNVDGSAVLFRGRGRGGIH